MITYAFLQQYWWLIISLLGGLLVFLLFVQGGNALIFPAGRSEEDKQLIVNSTGRKWEFTFTTLVLFGGAFFASFPLFYSTSFSGAYWVWVLILITFVFQAVSYEFQNKAGNILGKTAFRIFLTINGCLAPLLIGTASAHSSPAHSSSWTRMPRRTPSPLSSAPGRAAGTDLRPLRICSIWEWG